MRFELDHDTHHHTINGYGPDWVKVGERTFRQSLIVTPAQVVSDWPPQTFAALTAADFAAIAALTPEIVLLGTGSRQQFPAPALLRVFVAGGVGVEVMTTAAACRTYNIVMLEGRRVAVALLLADDD